MSKSKSKRTPGALREVGHRYPNESASPEDLSRRELIQLVEDLRAEVFLLLCRDAGEHLDSVVHGKTGARRIKANAKDRHEDWAEQALKMHERNPRKSASDIAKAIALEDDANWDTIAARYRERSEGA